MTEFLPVTADICESECAHCAYVATGKRPETILDAIQDHMHVHSGKPLDVLVTTRAQGAGARRAS